MYVGPTKFRYSKWRPSWTWAESCSVFFLLFFGLRINIWIWLGAFRNLSWNNIKTWCYRKWLRQQWHQTKHSMASVNLNKSPESVSIEIPPFKPHFIKFSKTVSYEVNLVSHCSHLEILLLSKFGSERGFFGRK